MDQTVFDMRGRMISKLTKNWKQVAIGEAELIIESACHPRHGPMSYAKASDEKKHQVSHWIKLDQISQFVLQNQWLQCPF